MKNIPIGQILVNNGAITQQQLESALKIQHDSPGKRLGDVLVEQGYITQKEFLMALQQRLNVKFVDLSGFQVELEATQMIPERIARADNIIPISKSEGVLTIATDDPLDFYRIEELKIITGMDVNTVLASKEDILTAIERYYPHQAAMNIAYDINQEYAQDDVAAFDQMVEISTDTVDNAPVVKLVNSMVAQGFSMNASDIHIEPTREATRVRMRVDGDLTQQMQLSSAAHEAIVTRLKILGGMNIAEKRIPQDGRFDTSISGQTVDIRVSTLPTIHGEKVVLRLLGANDAKTMGIGELGFSAGNLELFKNLISNPNGIVLVTGPTGSGKTTTLYAALQEVCKPNINIVTVEDPVEKDVDGISQVQVNPKAGLTFAQGLRSILRQDPDAIMVGEIRDQETAEIAIRAAITGHLVLSTLHTNDAASSVVRLVDMGVEPYLVASSIIGVVAQRLMKVNCPHCKKEHQTTPEEMKLLGLDKPAGIYQGAGCIRCGFTGYRGRTGVHEVLTVDKDIRRMIIAGKDSDEIREAALNRRMTSLQENAAQLVLDGVTSMPEYLKICYHLD